jgi:hypothetical protein
MRLAVAIHVVFMVNLLGGMGRGHGGCVMWVWSPHTNFLGSTMSTYRGKLTSKPAKYIQKVLYNGIMSL